MPPKPRTGRIGTSREPTGRRGDQREPRLGAPTAAGRWDAPADAEGGAWRVATPASEPGARPAPPIRR
jgi:hypothetical protein